jgi:hypothetical protein
VNEEISPELALVDPELATEARRSLPEPAPDVPAEREPSRSRRWPRKLVVGLAAVLVGSAAALVLARGDAEVAPEAATVGVLGATKIDRTPPRSLPASGRPSRVFSWQETEGAAFYYVVFLRNGKTFHTAETANPWLRVPDSLKFTPGAYRWSVRPAVAGDAGIVMGDAVLVRTFRVNRR